jgi:hypothetical protein
MGYKLPFPKKKKKSGDAECWWFMSVILAPWKADIRRIEV